MCNLTDLLSPSARARRAHLDSVRRHLLISFPAPFIMMHWAAPKNAVCLTACAASLLAKPHLAAKLKPVEIRSSRAGTDTLLLFFIPFHRTMYWVFVSTTWPFVVP